MDEKARPKFFLLQVSETDRENIAELAKLLRCSKSSAIRNVITQCVDALHEQESEKPHVKHRK